MSVTGRIKGQYGAIGVVRQRAEIFFAQFNKQCPR
ncbi:unnamed protein product [Protopolystoma xenopodis]|uniref:Uncharacterized protein n=1 Tax=Protopolystoma xenopodis TaxID=117903 RepID=A0A448XA70_9PLAT|nr:unnamed protein product [Protopolystoma xenopodis]